MKSGCVNDRERKENGRNDSLDQKSIQPLDTHILSMGKATSLQIKGRSNLQLIGSGEGGKLALRKHTPCPKICFFFSEKIKSLVPYFKILSSKLFRSVVNFL